MRALPDESEGGETGPQREAPAAVLLRGAAAPLADGVANRLSGQMGQSTVWSC